MKKMRLLSHQELIKPLLKDKKFRKELKEGVKRLKIIVQIVELREKKGMTQRELAQKLGVSQPYIARIENDEASNLSLETLMNIVYALDGDLHIQIRSKKAA